MRCETTRGEELLRGIPEQVLEVAHEPIHISFAGRLVDDVLVVVVAQTTAELLVVHLRFVFAHAPASCHLVRVRQLKLPSVTAPRYEVLTVLIRQQLK